MSTQINHYVLWGVFLPTAAANKYEVYEPYLDSPYNADMNPKDGVTVLSGEGYLVIGHVIAKSKNYEALGVVELEWTPELPEGCSTAIHALCEQLEVDWKPFRWIVLGHYR